MLLTNTCYMLMQNVHDPLERVLRIFLICSPKEMYRLIIKMAVFALTPLRMCTHLKTLKFHGRKRTFRFIDFPLQTARKITQNPNEDVKALPMRKNNSFQFTHTIVLLSNTIISVNSNELLFLILNHRKRSDFETKVKGQPI